MRLLSWDTRENRYRVAQAIITQLVEDGRIKSALEIVEKSPEPLRLRLAMGLVAQVLLNSPVQANSELLEMCAAVCDAATSSEK
jgi:hypothetical protein